VTSNRSNGACHRVDDDDDAFANRAAKMSAVISGSWHESVDDDQYRSWVRGYFDALLPYSECGGYINFMSDDDQASVGENYGPKWQKLRQIKQKYDPKNLFRLNQNILPYRA
jgi:FAD/FMN-containing dehydrogenase